MLATLILGILLTATVQGVLWGGFIICRKFNSFEFLNSRKANKAVLQISFVLYFTGFITTVYFMF